MVRYIISVFIFIYTHSMALSQTEENNITLRMLDKLEQLSIIITDLSNKNANLVNRIKEIEKNVVPRDAVIAIANDNGCPGDEWIRYKPSEGRIIIGVGQQPNGSEFSIWQRGGAEKVKLTHRELPPHNHIITAARNANSGKQFLSLSNKRKNKKEPLRIENTHFATDNHLFEEYDLDKKGKKPDPGKRPVGDQVHENMPPYIALFLCKKR